MTIYARKLWGFHTFDVGHDFDSNVRWVNDKSFFLAYLNGHTFHAADFNGEYFNFPKVCKFA